MNGGVNRHNMYPNQGPESFSPSPSSIPLQTQPSSSSPVPGPLLVGPVNCETVCPFCHARVKTAVRYTATTNTHLLALRCGLLGCCCIPYCMDSARNSDHYCPKCQKYLGTYKK